MMFHVNRVIFGFKNSNFPGVIISPTQTMHCRIYVKLYTIEIKRNYHTLQNHKWKKKQGGTFIIHIIPFVSLINEICSMYIVPIGNIHLLERDLCHNVPWKKKHVVI